ncbi:HisA/HisF-related TIM barrel protein [Ornithinimicrobium tianjinense]|uniref:1-(5-phosphoribosyl)-5-[(5-phosphoribosylamino) methylideneamino] imidazole-4-carboxamide isomerase n=1 Tax=Ornithinimicrobium tianjinense TaxID=1195761 RepID=A0A917BM05_9MICO|nr:HisA/HisF-related TIM barrel protein [Ornithinimicrobium tianjinense]GGF48845.1 1-(5-phosphoribosyl)-5-[(5-phosphoribosylamino) methylideneamino] imidazole-4-carboxamide isomerase [Ornithinimicrobium tianjinense]
MTAGAALRLLPAVDIAGGRADQVVDAGPDDPYEVASRWVEHGADHLHLVDLDRAFGRGDNARLLSTLVERLPVPVQLSGGLADEAAIDWAASTGARRLVLASSVLADADLLERVVSRHGGDRVVVAVDVRAGQVVSRGTTLSLGPLTDVVGSLPVLREVAHVLVADASRDGTRSGADLDLFTAVAGLVAPARVVASGGVATLDDLRALRALVPAGVTEVVLGAALYHHAFTLGEALEVCR